MTDTERATDEQVRPKAFHIMTKPIGAICNIDCKYCFYLEKENLYPETRNFRMPDDVLENYVRQYIQQQDAPEITFAWQGGEPTLMGLEFFQRAVEFQKKHCPAGKRISNALQTNGMLLNDAWCAFFRAHNFLIGLSIDGPSELHDRYRVDKAGGGTFGRVMEGLALLKKHGVEFNTLTVVNRHNARRPLEVYDFLCAHGSGFMQFIPLVERNGQSGDTFAAPPQSGDADSPVTPMSVESLAYGEFLCAIFDRWVRNDVGRVYVQLFEVQLAIWMGLPSSLCVFSETCGNALAMEHNGDVYSCDHYVYPEYRLGNIGKEALGDMVASPQQRKFGTDKRDALPQYCRDCDVRFACHGECPKHRFIQTPSGEPGLNYLCAGYKRFFHHIDPHMKTMAELLKARRSPAAIMPMLARRERKR